MLLNLILLSLLAVMSAVAETSKVTVKLPATIPHDTSLWEDDNHLADLVDGATVERMAQTVLKNDFDIKNKDQRMKVNFYNLFTTVYRGALNPGKLVRITSMVLCWIPQANYLTGKATLSLVDNRKPKTDPRRIESQVNFDPDKPFLGIFYHNFAVKITDLKYFDLEFMTHGINMEKGSMGRLSFGYKTVITGSRYYEIKNPEVFYLPVSKLPELSVESPEDIYNSFVKKLQKKKSKEVEYFTKMKSFVNHALTPINQISMDSETILKGLERDYEILKKYEEDARKYKLNDIRELEDAIEQTKTQMELLRPDPKITLHKEPSEPLEPIITKHEPIKRNKGDLL